MRAGVDFHASVLWKVRPFAYARAAAARMKIMPTNKKGLGSLLKICHATKLIGDSSARGNPRTNRDPGMPGL
jgi:hypothetical protein